MPEITIIQVLLAFLVCFVGEFLGIFGGAGFLIQPALLAIGIPPHIAVAHDASATAGASATSFYVFQKHKKIDVRLIVWWLPGVVIGPFLGIFLLSVISPQVLEKIIISLSLIGAVAMMFTKKEWGTVQGIAPVRHRILWSLASGFLLGFWIGFSGMGTGTISLMILVFVFGQTIKEATAAKTPIHLVSETLTALGFLWKGWLVWQLFLPMLAGCLLAGYFKAHVVIRLSEKVLKTIFLASVFVISGIVLSN